MLKKKKKGLLKTLERALISRGKCQTMNSQKRLECKYVRADELKQGQDSWGEIRT